MLSLRSAPALPPAPDPAWAPPEPSTATFAALRARVQALKPFVPQALPGRFAGGVGAGGEFRPITALAASFYDFGRLVALLEAPGLHEDKPGLIGRLGTLLGDHGVNIATFALGRRAPGANAIALIEIDEPPANAAPSLHVSLTFLLALALVRDFPRYWFLSLGGVALVWLATLFTRQHHLIDVASGAGLALLVAFTWDWLVRRRRQPNA